MATIAASSALLVRAGLQTIHVTHFSKKIKKVAACKILSKRESRSVDLNYCTRLGSSLRGSRNPTCSLSDEDKIGIAKDFIASDSGVSKPDLLAEEFLFEGPVVGPLSKQEFLKAVGSFDLKTAFPDCRTDANNFIVDGDDPDLVRFTTRFTGTHTGPLSFFGKVYQGEGVKVTSATEASSVKLTREGQITKFTTGYVVDRTGNTGGLGAMFGILHAIGHPVQSPKGAS